MSWRDRAACAGRDDIDWFPSGAGGRGEPKGYRENLNRARKVCDDCPVAEQCLELALELRTDHGIWAGTTPRQRRGMVRGRRRAPVAECGTDAGYYRHVRKLKERACDECRAAHCVATSERTRKRSA